MSKKGFCMKCREKGVEISDGKYRAKGARAFFVGTHKKCGSEVWLIVSAKEAEQHGVKLDKSSKSRKSGGRRKSKSKSKSKSKGGRKSRR